MLFNSLQYAVFLPIAVVAYYAAPARAKLSVLLVASYLFYASWSPVYLLLIAGLTVVNYALGFVIARWLPDARSASAALWLGVAVNLLTLGYYKYVDFVLTNALQTLGWLGVATGPMTVSPILPLGLSFFIFEFIHYLVDVRNGQGPMRSLVQFAVFAAFFPTQVAGPIKRFEAFAPQMAQPRSFSWTYAGEGARLLVIGLFKKIAIADNMAPIVELGFHQVAGGDPSLRPLDAWLAVMAFSLQIYFDFSGYTDMGRGSALLMGYTVPENFRRPYLAANISDFWRRWHISLSSWLRDYLYIPLGGNRGNRDRNLFLTMALGGLWHGASWTFVVWGAYHGALLVAYWRLRRWFGGSRTGTATTGLAATLGALAMWPLTFVLVCVGWVFFRADSFPQALAMIGSMVGLGQGAPSVLPNDDRLVVVLAVGGMFVVEWFAEWRERLAGVLHTEAAVEPAGGGSMVLRPIGLTLLFMLTLLLQPATAPRFIYFQF